MSVVICPGIHEPNLTQSFLAGLRGEMLQKSSPLSEDFSSNLSGNVLIFPAHKYSAVSAFDILQMLGERFNYPKAAPSLVFICFSAGVVGAIGAAWGWQLMGGSVKALIALDGWGVLLAGSFPIHRLSHDYFTHWSSTVLESGQDNFYADPPVSHLELWRSPQTIMGWRVHSIKNTQPRSYTTAAQFLTMLLERYGE